MQPAAGEASLPAEEDPTLEGPFTPPSEAELKLRRWRAGYDARRAEAAEREAWRRRRARRRLLLTGGGLGGLGLLAAGVILLVAGPEPPREEAAAGSPVPGEAPAATRAADAPGTPEPAPGAAAAPAAAPSPSRAAPAARGEAASSSQAAPVARGEAASPLPEPPAVVEGTLKVWSAEDTEWVFFDYRGTEPIELRWTDAAGRPVLEPWTCTNRVRRGIRRCYVGRTHERIAIAQVREGATPGTWSVSACAAGDPAACVHLATFEVPRLAAR